MAHNTLTQATWPDGYVPGHADFEDIDRKTMQAVNGDQGGVWAPAAPLEIGGAGLKLSGGAGAPHTVTGAGTAIQVASAAAIRTVSGGKIQLGGGAPDWPTFTDAAGVATPRFRTFTRLPEPTAIPAGWSTNATSLQGSAVAQGISIPCNSLHNGATLTNIRLFMQVQQAHANLPAYFPLLQLWRKEFDATDTATLMTSPTPVGGYPTTVGSWYLGGSFTSFDWAVVNANVIANYNHAYFIVLYDEYGANSMSGNQYSAFQFSFSQIPDMAFP